MVIAANQREVFSMGNNLTELIFLLDRRGSMGGLAENTIGGFNVPLEKQNSEPGDASVTAVLFDHETNRFRIS